MKTKKKAIIITAIVLIAFIIIGVVYAVITGSIELTNKVKTGSVKIEDINLSLKNEKGEEAGLFAPADINVLSWQAKNTGTSAALTRHTVEIYWEDEETASRIKIYPANLTREAIMTDFVKGENAEYAIETVAATTEINNEAKYGIKFQFIGDTLDGTDKTGVSKEINYNINSAESAEKIDSTIVTDDSDATQDNIAYKIAVNPKMSYLDQGKKATIKITTEAMQYTENGEASWQVVDTQQINQ